jgi:gluconate kinase
MKKLFFFIPVIFLIIATTFTKNSTKQLDKKIFETRENLRVLKDKYELVMLEYNYLTSPKKLMEYQKKYFDNELLESDIESLNWIENSNKEIIIKKIVSNNE